MMHDQKNIKFYNFRLTHFSF